MKKKLIIAFALVLSFLCFLASCGTNSSSKHEHSYEDATCEEPKTCEDCGKTKGEALGHSFLEATCEEPKTCEVCGKTEGYSLGHSFRNATCTKAKTCTVCGATFGKPNGHTYSKGVCSVCESIEAGAYEEQMEILNDAIEFFESMEEISTILSGAYKDSWYFSMYAASNYYDYNKALRAYSETLGFDEDDVNSAIISVLKGVGLETTKLNGLAALATKESMFLIVRILIDDMGVFDTCEERITLMVQELGKVNGKVVGMERFEAVVECLNAVLDFYEFATFPDSSYSYSSYVKSISNYKDTLSDLKEIVAEEMK
jgi:hypothetical protein